MSADSDVELFVCGSLGANTQAKFNYSIVSANKRRLFHSNSSKSSLLDVFLICGVFTDSLSLLRMKNCFCSVNKTSLKSTRPQMFQL